MNRCHTDEGDVVLAFNRFVVVKITVILFTKLNKIKDCGRQGSFSMEGELQMGKLKR